MFSSQKEQQFFNEWYFRGHLDENYDADRQFFYFYALFDHLFKTYTAEKEEKLKLQGLKFDSSERSRIKYFLYNIFYIEPEKSQFETYNPLAALNNGNLTQIISKLKIKSSDKTLSTFILPPFEIMTALFMEVYDIRCNLFHGNADLSNFDNNKLIEEANVVLKGFLGRLFTTNLSENK